MGAGFLQQKKGVASEIAHKAIAELARATHEHSERLPDILAGDIIRDHLQPVRSVLRLNLDQDETWQRWQPIERGEVSEVAAVHVDGQEVEAALCQSFPFEDAREAVVAGV